MTLSFSCTSTTKGDLVSLFHATLPTKERAVLCVMTQSLVVVERIAVKNTHIKSVSVLLDVHY
jgi:hypothetical protein